MFHPSDGDIIMICINTNIFIKKICLKIGCLKMFYKRKCDSFKSKSVSKILSFKAPIERFRKFNYLYIHSSVFFI